MSLSKLTNWFAPRNKAVADGALSFYLDHRVSSRVANKTFGAEAAMFFDPSDPEHLARSDTKYRHISGEEFIPETFSVILPKVRINLLHLLSSSRWVFREPAFRKKRNIANITRSVITIRTA